MSVFSGFSTWLDETRTKFSKQEAAPAPGPENDLERLLRAVTDGMALQSLSENPGWRVIQSALHDRFEKLNKELREASDMSAVTKLQAQLVEVETFLKIVPDGIKRMREAQARLNPVPRKEAEDGA